MRIRNLLVSLSLLLATIPAYAVTREEMEQARTIAAQQYLRWANDGSGYLDEVSVSTMSDLEKVLKAKEKENLKSFKAVSTPSDYASWDKNKLVEYWSVTFFNSPGLIDKGRAAKGRVKSKISRLRIADPAPEAPAEKPAVAETPDKPVSQVSEESAVAASPADASAPEGAQNQELGQDLAAAEAALAQDSALAENMAADTDTSKSGGSSVWVYVLALCVLVGIVVWLVIFASKTMRGNNEDYTEVEEAREKKRRKAVEKEYEHEPEPEPVSTPGTLGIASDSMDDIRLREKYAESLARKNEEIRLLNREILDLREESLRLGEENGHLKAEIATLKSSLEASRQEMTVHGQRPERKPAEEIAGRVDEAEDAPRRRRPAGNREIFLGKVNSKGLFIRADRTLTPGKSIYRLTTSDGFTGSFRVVTDEEIMDMALDNPLDYLSGGCVAKDIEDTDGMMEIMTESAGTAIFEDGCWRVLRKAKISYR